MDGEDSKLPAVRSIAWLGARRWIIIWLRAKELNAEADKAGINAEGLVKLNANEWRHSLPAALVLKMQAHNRVLMVEAVQAQLVYVMEAKCNKRVVSGVLRSGLSGLEYLNLCRKRGHDPTVSSRLDVASPQIHRVNFSIVE